VVSEASLEQLLAQHIFSAFIWAVTLYIPKDRINRNSTVVEDGDADAYGNPIFSSLQNKELLEIATSIQKSGMGSLEDVLLCIIPPLSCENKLPVDAAVDFVR
jgi:hypothetical protein